MLNSSRKVSFKLIPQVHLYKKRLIIPENAILSEKNTTQENKIEYNQQKVYSSEELTPLDLSSFNTDDYTTTDYHESPLTPTTLKAFEISREEELIERKQALESALQDFQRYDTPKSQQTPTSCYINSPLSVSPLCLSPRALIEDST